MATKWWHNFKPIYPVTWTSLDSFWTKTLSGTNTYLKLVGPDFTLGAYVGFLDFTNLNVVLLTLLAICEYRIMVICNSYLLILCFFFCSNFLCFLYVIMNTVSCPIWKAGLQKRAWRFWWTPSWTWANNAALQQRRQMVTWASLRKALLAGQGKRSFLSAEPWWGYSWTQLYPFLDYSVQERHGHTE